MMSVFEGREQFGNVQARARQAADIRAAGARPRSTVTPPGSPPGWKPACEARRSTGSTSSPSGIPPAMPALTDPRLLEIDGRALRIEDVVDVARGRARVRLSHDAGFLDRIGRGAEFIDRLIAEDGVVYGVSTGYGDSCTVAIPPALVAELPHHLYAYHGCGLGRFLDPQETRAVLLVRLQSLAQGVSGVSLGLLRQLEALLAHDILPLIPAEGSVGASGDLTPLSYVAAVLCGERECWHEGRVMPAADALVSTVDRQRWLAGYVGRLSSEKGPDLFLDALIALCHQHPQLDAVMLGDGPEREALQARIDAASRSAIYAPLKRIAHVRAQSPALQNWGVAKQSLPAL